MIIPQLQNLPDPEDNIDTWCTYIVLADSAWSGLLKKHLTAAHRLPLRRQHHLPHDAFDAVHDPYQDSDANINNPPSPRINHDDTDHPPPPENTEQHTCHLCNKTFTTSRGLGLHKRKTHGVIPPIALRTHSNTCIICGSELASRKHLLQHLNNRIDCAIPTLSQLPPMSLEHYTNSVHALATADTSLTRPMLPRTGPIPFLNGAPQSQSTPAIHPLIP
eukprot:6481351-Amphidinium_carterae.2